MESWVTPAVIIAFVSGLFTYLGAKSQNRLHKDDKAFTVLEKRLEKLEEKVEKLEQELEDKNELLAEKDKLILQLEYDLQSSKEENRYLKNKINKLEGGK